MAKKKATAKAAQPGDNSNGNVPTPEETRELFLTHKRHFKAARQKVSDAQADFKKVKDKAKNDGFTVKQIETAIKLETPQGEAEIRRTINDDMQAAIWVGCDIGSQLELFKTQVFNEGTDRAFDEGEQASMENKPAKPDYAPDTPQYRAYMNGYFKHQEVLASKLKKPNAPEARAD